MRHTRRLPTLLALAALSACDHTPTEPGGGALRTQTTGYLARYEGGDGGNAQYGFTVVARFTNATARTVYLENCFGRPGEGPIFGLELLDRTTDRFGPAYAPVWACVGVDLAHMIAIRPGATRVDTLHLTGPNAVDGVTQQPLGVFEGRMRLVYTVFTDDGQPASELGRSNTFQVQRAR